MKKLRIDTWISVYNEPFQYFIRFSFGKQRNSLTKDNFIVTVEHGNYNRNGNYAEAKQLPPTPPEELLTRALPAFKYLELGMVGLEIIMFIVTIFIILM